MGPGGVMVPYVNTAEEPAKAVLPCAIRAGSSGGGALSSRRGIWTEFDAYFAEANSKLLTILQIETGEAVEHVEEIAAVWTVWMSVYRSAGPDRNLGIPGTDGSSRLSRLR